MKIAYSSVPNKRACTIINFGGKSPTYMTLFGPTHLLFWGIFPTYMFIPSYKLIDFEDFFPFSFLFHPTLIFD